MNNIINDIKKDTNNSPDIIIRKIKINSKEIHVIFNEVLCDGSYINDFILKRITMIKNEENIKEELLNLIPSNSIKLDKEYKDMLNDLFQGFCLVLVDKTYLMIEARAHLDTGITFCENEVSVIGPNDAFCENFNKNLGLIRKRIRTNSLSYEKVMLGKQSNTKIGICYMGNIADINLVKEVKKKLEKIDIDGIIDTGYIREMLLDNESIFPTVNITQRPDAVSQALLEGKVAIIVDNTPYAMIIPTFFIDFFHTPDDYYQKSFNITFIRTIRFMAFIISVFLPAIYISVTTYNPEAIPLKLLINFASQRLNVPFPGFVEALIMISSFEILKESDARTPKKIGTSVSILGGLVLGEAAVSAGIVSPIMIIVIAMSIISSLLFSSNSLIYSIRYFRVILLILSAFFGLFGVFIGITILISKICSITSFGYSYTTPFSPLIKTELRDTIIKTSNKNKRYRNPLLAKKNIIRGRFNEKN